MNYNIQLTEACNCECVFSFNLMYSMTHQNGSKSNILINTFILTHMSESECNLLLCF